MDRLWHGCYYEIADGTNRIIASGENCLLRTNKCFWKAPCDVASVVKAKSHAKSKLTVSFQAVDTYYKRKDIKTIDFMEIHIYLLIIIVNTFTMCCFSFVFCFASFSDLWYVYIIFVLPVQSQQCLVNR